MTGKSQSSSLGITKGPWEPPQIKNMEDIGLSEGFLQDLALKIMYFQGQMTGHEIAEEMHLPFANIVSKIMDFLKREQMCEVRGSAGLGAASYQYIITMKGSARAREKLERTTYVGPAPVPWDDYVAAIKQQGAQRSESKSTANETISVTSHFRGKSVFENWPCSKFWKVNFPYMALLEMGKRQLQKALAA